VTRVYLSPPDSGAAFTTGHVDAWATWDPFLTMALKSYDARLLANGAAIGSENAVVLIASRGLAETKRAVLDTAFRTLSEENAWAVAHPADAGAIWAGAMGLSADLAGPIGRNNAVPTRAVSPADETQIGEIANWTLAEKIIPKKPDVAAGVLQLR
jgi:sulfonate transport system substrate-binding protein